MATQPSTTPTNYQAMVDIHYVPAGSPMGTRPQVIKKGTVIASGVLSVKDVKAMLQNGHLQVTSSSAAVAAKLTAEAPVEAARVDQAAAEALPKTTATSASEAAQ
ncbi:MAG TPA: hypothetical protein VNC39_01625 [Acidocella sp.]|jgi:hypothetical protein|uniref:hypothetical protein n=1 Tax=Acidocella sp. TaxID=50710 RepID=UPI002CCA0073|nr:hypothetical protein [Acidocella sp.]HVE20650.1 hypothetical protein [Acidocella sp.]